MNKLYILVLLAHINALITANMRQIVFEKGTIARKTLVQMQDKARQFVQKNPVKSAMSVAGILTASGGTVGFFVWLRHLINRKTNPVSNAANKKQESNDNPVSKNNAKNDQDEKKDDLPGLDQLRDQLKNGEIQLDTQTEGLRDQDNAKKRIVTSPKAGRFGQDVFIMESNLTEELSNFLVSRNIHNSVRVMRRQGARGIIIDWSGRDLDGDQGDAKIESINRNIAVWCKGKSLNDTLPNYRCYNKKKKVKASEIWNQEVHQMGRLSLPEN